MEKSKPSYEELLAENKNLQNRLAEEQKKNQSTSELISQ